MNRRTGSLRVARVLAPGLVAAVLLPLPNTARAGEVAEVAAVRLDEDGDGVAGPADACPGTPRGARALVHGCAAPELVHAPRVLFDPVLAQLQQREADLAPARDFAEAARWMAKGRARIVGAAEELHAGQVCKASRTMDHASADLRRAQASMAEAVASRSAALLAYRRASGELRERDVTAEEITVGFLRLLDGDVARSVSSALQAARETARLCAWVTGDLNVRARVTEVDDAAGLIRLDDGRVLAVGAGAQKSPIQEGLVVAAKGLLFQDGTGAVDDIKIDAQNGPPPGNFAIAECLSLRIAPVQRFPLSSNGPYVLHHPAAYDSGSGELQLERGMRLAAAAAPCSFDPPPGQFARATLQIEVKDGLVLEEIVAPELEDGESPVEFPAFAGGDDVLIHTTVFLQACAALADGTNKCSAPAPHVEKLYSVALRPRGSYATAVYSKTGFYVTGDPDPAHFDTGTVVAMDLTIVPASTNPYFTAEGYRVTDGVSSRPQIETVDQGQEFAVYADDIYPPDDVLFPSEATGVDKSSALVWPHVVGTRNGREFWYTAKLPDILRDLLNVCPDDSGTSYQDPDSYYKLPFTGGWPAWIVSKGNADDPGNAHSGAQAFSLDFVASTGTDIHAARPGFVAAVVEDEDLNSADYPPGYTGIGNYVYVKHEDGTYGVYFHLEQWGALVSQGDKVKRGQHIAEVGNTGTSSEPHLHWDETIGLKFDDDGNLIGTGTNPSRYEAHVDDDGGFPPDFSLRTCYLPRTGHKVVSTQ